jgi:signal transduction histidine kinase
LAPLLVEVAELYGAVAEDQGIVLRLNSPREIPAFGDKAMLQQAIANLVDNAVKFSPPGGLVALTAAVSAMVTVSVSDQGPGIPLADRERATDRFYRGEAARSTPGSGLGLSLVLAVARLHGGHLRFEDNQPGLRAILALPPPEDAEGWRGEMPAAEP